MTRSLRKLLQLPPQAQRTDICRLRLHTKSYNSQESVLKTANVLEINQQRQNSSNIIKSPFDDIVIPNKLITEVIWDTVDRYPEATALKCGILGQTYTYAKLQKLSFRFANSLRKAGFGKGEKIALVLPNCPDFAVITFGSLEAEMVVSFVNHVYTADEICHQIKDSGSVCVVSGAAQLKTVLSAIDKVEKATQTKQVRRVIVMDIPPPDTLPSGVTRYSEMIADSVDHTRKNSSIQSKDLAVLPYSSGTTGLAKGVCLSHYNIVGNILQFSGITGNGLLTPAQGQDVLLGLLPFYHIYGLTVILLYTLHSGARIVTLPKFEQDTFIRTLENEQISVMFLVPPLILFMGASERVTAKHLSSVRLLFSGAAPLGPSDLEKVKVKLPSGNKCSVSQAYGMTELSPVATNPGSPPKNLATVGAPVPNTYGKIVDIKTGIALGPNEEGELCFKGPQVMLGYHNNQKATDEMIDSEGWLKTGDTGYHDEEGFFYVKDRLKELIKVKGFQVPPAELEEVLRTHPLVSDVGVIGVPDPRTGETPVAYIVAKKGKPLTVEHVKEFLSEKVARHKQVSQVFFVDSIPKSAAGKILRKDLREIYRKSHK